MRFKGTDVKIEWTNERGVTSDGQFVSIQSPTELEGGFVEKYQDMSLPSR